MKITCRICGNEFDHPDNKRGTKPSVCPSKECQATQSREYQARWARDKRAGKSPDTKRCRRCGEQFTSEGNGRICPKCADKPKLDKPKPKKIAPAKPKPDTSKAGWPEDTKKCVDCGQFFMDDGRSKLCPVCKAARKEERYSRHKAEATKPAITKPEPLHLKSIDEVLEEAKAAGYSPEDYGKYKAAKALAKAGPIDINIPNAKPRVAEYDIRQESGYEGKYEHDPETLEKEDDMICKNCGFDVEPEFDEGRVGCPACDSNAPEDCIDELFEAELEEPCREEPEGLVFRVSERELLSPLKDDEPYSFLEDIKELIDITTRAALKPIDAYPIAQALLEKGMWDMSDMPPQEDVPNDYIDPAWGFDRKPMGGSK